MPHTPGPWSIGGSLIAARNGTHNAVAVALVLHQPHDRSRLTRDEDRDAPMLHEADDNARLLAAAPSLLAFVRKVAGATFSENREHAHTVTDEARYLLARIEDK